MKKLRFLIAVCISGLPFNFMRVFMYRHLLKYQITNSQIGIGTIIDIESCTLENVSIGKLNMFTGPFLLDIKSKSTIGSGNIFRAGKWVVEPDMHALKFKHRLSIGHNVTITNKHYFDLAGLIEIGNDSWIAGYASQFWTHGGEKLDNDIIIADACYIASATRFTPGAEISKNTLVGMGSVVTKKFKQENIMLVGVPAAIKKEDFYWQKDL